VSCPICERRDPGGRWCRTCKILGVVFVLVAVFFASWVLGIVATWQPETTIQEGRRF